MEECPCRLAAVYDRPLLPHRKRSTSHQVKGHATDPTTLLERFRGNRVFGSLDGLRSASIIAVIWDHTHRDTLDWLPGASRGFLGVDLFFVISGFLIVTLILRERAATGTTSLRNFYGRRVLRIFPAYYALLAALSIFFLVFKFPVLARPFFAELPYDASYTSNLIAGSSIMGISWSLATEEQFYLLWPPVEKFLGRLVLPLLGVIVIANQLINFRLADPWLQRRFGVSHDDLFILQATFTPICLGVGLAHLLNSDRGFAIAYRFLGSREASLYCLLLLLAIGNSPAADISGWQRLAVQLSMVALVGGCVLREDHRLQKVLTWSPIKRLGVISYGVYLYHLSARHLVHRLLLHFGKESPSVEFLLCVTLTICISELSFRFFEQPVLSLKRYLR